MVNGVGLVLVATFGINGAPAMSPGKRPARQSIYATKSRPDQKMDAAVALMMGIGRAMV